LSIASEVLKGIEILCRNTADSSNGRHEVDEGMHRVELAKECLACEPESLLPSFDPLLSLSYTKRPVLIPIAPSGGSMASEIGLGYAS
jgi:hypothetical protein